MDGVQIGQEVFERLVPLSLFNRKNKDEPQKAEVVRSILVDSV